MLVVVQIYCFDAIYNSSSSKYTSFDWRQKLLLRLGLLKLVIFDLLLDELSSLLNFLLYAV